MAASVGIIANPASGKDIRRLVAHGSVFSNYEKVNIIRRVLRGLDALGITDVLAMPDAFGLVGRACEEADVRLSVTFLDMAWTNTSSDSAQAAQMMVDAGVKCLITLGGDGTNRAVAHVENAPHFFVRHLPCSPDQIEDERQWPASPSKCGAQPGGEDAR